MSEHRNRILRPLFVPLAIVLLAGCGEEPEPSESLQPAVVRAALGSAERIQVAERVELQGAVEAERSAAISTRVLAMVTATPVREGQEVAAGQLLLAIDPKAAEGQLAQARGALAQARAALALARRNFERFEALAASDAASELELDLARMQYEQAQGAVEQAEGAVAAASSVAADSRVVAPFAGRVARRMVEVGDLAAPGRPLLMLESAGGRRLALSVPESAAAAARLAVGDELEVRIDARPELGTLVGRVVEMTPGADPATHSFGVKVELGAADLPTGATGRTWVPTGHRPAVVAPAAAVLAQGGTTLVVEMDEDQRARSRVVTLGEALPDGRIEVLSGLAGGESLLLDLPVAPPLGARVEVTAEERP